MGELTAGPPAARTPSGVWSVTGSAARHECVSAPGWALPEEQTNQGEQEEVLREAAVLTVVQYSSRRPRPENKAASAEQIFGSKMTTLRSSEVKTRRAGSTRQLWAGETWFSGVLVDDKVKFHYLELMMFLEAQINK